MCRDIEVAFRTKLVCFIEEGDGPAPSEDAVLALGAHVELLVECELARVETRARDDHVLRLAS